MHEVMVYVGADYTTFYIQRTIQVAGWLNNKPCTRTSGLINYVAHKTTFSLNNM